MFDFLSIGMKVLDRVLPDKAAREAAQLELLKLQQAGELQSEENELKAQLAQIDVNKAEATSESLFVSGWRPAVGWVCVLGLMYTYICQPLLSWFAATKGWPSSPPIDTADLLILLGGMLGFGTLRSFEKVKGVAGRPPA